MFQERFAVSGKEFRSRQSVGRWAGVASVPRPSNLHVRFAILVVLGLVDQLAVLRMRDEALCAEVHAVNIIDVGFVGAFWAIAEDPDFALAH